MAWNLIPWTIAHQAHSQHIGIIQSPSTALTGCCTTPTQNTLAEVLMVVPIIATQFLLTGLTIAHFGGQTFVDYILEPFLEHVVIVVLINGSRHGAFPDRSLPESTEGAVLILQVEVVEDLRNILVEYPIVRLPEYCPAHSFRALMPLGTLRPNEHCNHLAVLVDFQRGLFIVQEGVDMHRLSFPVRVDLCAFDLCAFVVVCGRPLPPRVGGGSASVRR